ncbi:Ig-like domain-containing protein [Paenibacillus sp. 7124]|uniref:Ig-like domain-containing protein n=1 Tax=Paenibacillus apii TaxID=1850370 RepID=A0A6M1PMK3_9BACL|nr:Ig-like domain-containing protein [Paenibacillus apii]NGM84709.1 Ig-like domain-containing protein [Paenibacillus apii]
MVIRKSWWRVIAIFIILLTAAIMYWPLTTFAEVGDGSGGGGGPAVPLYMDWSYPRDGETNISINPIIQCKFSHNVAHFEVQKRNKTLFSLRKEDGTDVPIRAFAADVQIEFDKRQYIYLSPINSLEENTKYYVSVQEGVQAKNGMATEKEQQFSFVTGSKNYSVPLLIDIENKASGEEQAIENAHSTDNSDHSIQSEDFPDDKQIESEALVQQTDVSQMSAQTEEEAQKETEIKLQTQTQIQSAQESVKEEAAEEEEEVQKEAEIKPQAQTQMQTQTQTQAKGTGIASRISWILVAAILILAFILSTVVRIKWGGSPKLPGLTFTEIKDHYGKEQSL